MQLVKRRPIALPVLRNGRWYDDFAVTGAVEYGYGLISGAKDKVPDGIKLRATTGTAGGISIPFAASNFLIELKAKRITGANFNIGFRQVDGNNRWYIDYGTNLNLTKGVSNVYTVMATVANINSYKERVYSIRCVGSSISVLIDGIQVASVDDVSNISGKILRLGVFDSTAGVAQSIFQYLAIKPL